MNFYDRHIGDYLKDTSHLSLLEHGVYGRLLDVYYTRETGIPEADAARLIGARTKDERAALASVLHEFFSLVDGVYVQARAAREIERYRRKAERNREVGRLGGRPPKSRTHEEPPWFPQEPSGFPVGSVLETQTEPSQYPVASNQNPEEKEGDSGSAPSAAPPPLPPPSFDGRNADVLNGKAVVPIAMGWELPEQWGLDAEALGWKPREVVVEAEKFRQYWVSGKGSGKRRSVKGWRQSWSTWLAKAAENRR